MGLDKGGGVCMQRCAVQPHCLLCHPEGGVLNICFYIGFWFCDVLVHSCSGDNDVASQQGEFLAAHVGKQVCIFVAYHSYVGGDMEPLYLGPWFLNRGQYVRPDVDMTDRSSRPLPVMPPPFLSLAGGSSDHQQGVGTDERVLVPVAVQCGVQCCPQFPTVVCPAL